MPDFDGSTYEPSRDHDRLTTQLERVRAFMSDGLWRSLGVIADAIDAPEASVSARLRDLRKEKFGAHVIERRNVAGGVWVYRLTVPNPKQLELVSV